MFNVLLMKFHCFRQLYCF